MISKEYSDGILSDLIKTLYVVPLEELEEIRGEWLNQVSKAGVSSEVIAFCNALTDAVIENKQEKARAEV